MNDNVPSQTQLREHAGALRLHGLLAHWGEVMGQPETARWVAQLLAWEAPSAPAAVWSGACVQRALVPSSPWRTSTGSGLQRVIEVLSRP